jgi:DNA-directed RNA polymerase specialized sigma24 family protein
MTESFYEELSGLEPEDAVGENTNHSPDSLSLSNSEASFLAALPVVRAIVSRKVFSSWQSEASDMLQEISLRLLKWRAKYADRGDRMSPAEWESFAARTAYNEINRFYSNQNAVMSVPIEEAYSIPAADDSVGGRAPLEFTALTRIVWQEICGFTLRQRRALLLSSLELVVYISFSGVSDKEIAEVLEFTSEEWEKVKSELPLSDLQIAQLIGRKNDKNADLQILTKSVKKGRHEARRKLRRFFKK